MKTANVECVELLENAEGKQECTFPVMQCATEKDADAICKKLNRLNAVYAKTTGYTMKMFYRVAGR